ncbi:hypothetical protein GDO81_002685 [Engystomops pustulosus]|uniref:Uncharacterized protein n=1 Tax=Engystomops pustulosus TaxID=76066 RepID=A0AAV7DN73_ENGPU|nr:hypothetical protein GDO81_002685 [Engystomops pustulosus]
MWCRVSSSQLSCIHSNNLLIDPHDPKDIKDKPVTISSIATTYSTALYKIPPLAKAFLQSLHSTFLIITFEDSLKKGGDGSQEKLKISYLVDKMYKMEIYVVNAKVKVISQQIQDMNSPMHCYYRRI